MDPLARKLLTVANSSRLDTSLRDLRRTPESQGGYYRPPDPGGSPFRRFFGNIAAGPSASFRQLGDSNLNIFRREDAPPRLAGKVRGGVGPDIQADPRSYGPGAAGGPGEVDWATILAALEGQRPSGGGVGVNRGLFQLSETPAEQAMLQREMDDIEARRLAGDTALRSGWGNVQSANAAAADKARSMVAERGDAAAGAWSQAAQQARDLSAARASAAGDFEGRAQIDVSPDAGSADWVGFMESQAPAERRLAERQQEILGSDLDWMAGMAGAQGEAYAADLRRQSNVLSFERAREHNLRVQDRIAQERMALAQMEMQAQSTNASLAAQRAAFDPFAQLNNMVGSAAVQGNPGLLAQQLGVTPQQAQRMIDNFLSGTQATVQAATPVR